MVDHPADSGYELVLDNRKLIIAFVVLFMFCGCFFVVGFMEGKRQGYQAGAQTAAETAAKPSPEESGTPAEIQSASTDSDAKLKNENTEEKPLNWYKDVSGQGGKPEIAAPAIPPKPAPKTAASVPAAEPVVKTTANPTASAEPAPKPPANPTASAEPASKPSANPAASSASATYSVQVGAFRQRQQAEVKIQLLRSKGFEGRIEPPQSPEALYLLKVGRFKSRAEAVAVQIRLKKSGFSSFIKTN